MGFSTSTGTWKTLNSSPDYGGRYFTIGGNTIFFPASGYRDYTVVTLSSVGTDCSVWSAVPSDSDCGWYLWFNSNNVTRQNYRRSNGFSVRPVQE